ncbi:MAG TPA: transketolase C-terminal domain-containing protein [Candidatus Saccharimonadales bacterium]|nr:transketolase C-terminal domain-containing protein [Candidatus Saccharimonadales bacterium]
MHAAHLVANLLDKDVAVEVMKKGYSRGLVEAGKQHEAVVALSSDVVSSTGTDAFAAAFPDRFIQVGISEQNLVTVASGLAAIGKLPFAAAYGAFSPGRNWEQIRTTICLNNRPVKLIGTHVGLSDAPDGGTHQVLEDIALTRVLPNMTVIAPCDSVEAAKATMALVACKTPSYMRVARDNTPIITTADSPFRIGEAYVFRVGDDVTIIATGRMTHQALVAAEILRKDGVSAEVLHVPTIKPLDVETILRSVRKTKAVVTAEEAQIAGGLGGAIAELLGEELPVPLRRVGMRDHYGESGTPKELFEHFGLTATHIALSAHEMAGSK